MSAPTEGDESTEEEQVDHDSSGESRLERAVTDLASHWQAMLFAAGCLAVAGWAAFLNQEMSPKWYVPLLTTYAVAAVGYVYLAERSSLSFGSTGVEA
jgi:hypothetical protein